MGEQNKDADETKQWSAVNGLLESIADAYTTFEGILEKTYIDTLERHESEGRGKELIFR